MSSQNPPSTFMVHTIIPLLCFADEEKVVHILPMSECHVETMRGSTSITYKGRAYTVFKGSTIQFGPIDTVLPFYQQTAALMNAQAPE